MQDKFKIADAIQVILGFEPPLDDEETEKEAEEEEAEETEGFEDEESK